MTNEPQHDEVTEEEKRRWDQEEEENRRWDQEEEEERRRDQTNNVNDEVKAETEPILSDSLSLDELTREPFPKEIEDIIARLKIKVDDSDLSLKQAQDLIHKLARLLDETGLCERHNITKKIKEILKDKIRTGKVTGRWIERCLPTEYKRTYVKSELSLNATSTRTINSSTRVRSQYSTTEGA